MSAVGLRLPTGADDWRLMSRTARLVLGSPAYATLALASASVALSGFVVVQNLALAEFALTGPLDLSDRLTILLGLFPFLGTNYGPVAEVLLAAVAALTGVDIAMVAYHLREHGITVEKGSGGSAVGLALGAVGAGCAACGSAVLAGVLSLFGVAGAGTLLPLDGIEFSLLALVALLLSIFWVADGMRGGEIRGCPL